MPNRIVSEFKINVEGSKEELFPLRQEHDVYRRLRSQKNRAPLGARLVAFLESYFSWLLRASQRIAGRLPAVKS
ncbi:MAG: hypothetical protein DWQ47_03830 [Acidobacteria bacterium]|nr:MAG: hypothetical protein DWQ32_07380 [Acidobacteriota bacterium]REK01525.1 MAG: hypothetical protein DWQ38_03815 [Acidobacteriota bacterium]REK14481.1 MAG: hypothetical protein DWQ43_13070 [Acidobacteriota bacterium]REK45196.1 MAG: hypothetical protein DWQ47_03830 [Acidobacteriota bacterium]